MPTPTVRPTQTTAPSATVTITMSPIPPTATTQPTQPPATATPSLKVCSPITGIALTDLSPLIVNPFAPPRLGSDDPHQGIDFADIDPVYQIALEGRRVNAVIEGQVAGVINDRFPYGNAILVETPLEQLPAAWLPPLQIPTPATPRQGHPSLTCPETSINLKQSSARSLYLMYAHLEEPVTLEPGDMIACGQPIGAIGNSGNSLNPHLHLELRVGPAGMRFESMAHYTGSATPVEMANYCLWRVSEAFQLLDPLQLLSPNPKSSP
jgi:murein DD-endopeptidase MepM/ murein hydrolase activator NlpD